MKKTLLLIRHAKTEKNHESGIDFERRLTDRGKKDAQKMAAFLRDENISIDVFLSSPAVRARKTCRIFADVYKAKDESLLMDSRLYLPESSSFIAAILDLDDKINHVAIFSHNPGITEFASSLCKDVHINHMPTGSVFCIETEITHWKDFEKTRKRFVFFKQPSLL